MTMPKPARIWAYPGEPVEHFGGLWHAPLRQYLLQRLEAQVPGVTELFNLNQGSYEVMSMEQLVAWPGNVFILERTPLACTFIDRRLLLLACVPPDEREELALFQTWMPRQVSHSSSLDQLETVARLRELRIQVTRRELSRWKKARDKSTRPRIGI